MLNHSEITIYEDPDLILYARAKSAVLTFMEAPEYCWAGISLFFFGLFIQSEKPVAMGKRPNGRMDEFHVLLTRLSRLDIFLFELAAVPPSVCRSFSLMEQ